MEREELRNAIGGLIRESQKNVHQIKTLINSYIKHIRNSGMVEADRKLVYEAIDDIEAIGWFDLPEMKCLLVSIELDIWIESTLMDAGYVIIHGPVEARKYPKDHTSTISDKKQVTAAYALKKACASHINKILLKNGLAIVKPEDRPGDYGSDLCIIYAIASRDGTGRYTLESKKTKKRGGAYKSLFELQPLYLLHTGDPVHKG